MSDSRSNVAYLNARQQQAPRLEPFQPFYAAEIEGKLIKPREWLVENVVMEKTVCLFAGPPKIGKSLLLQQLLTASALGMPWLDRETKRVKTFGLFTEDPQEELERRQHDINKHYGVNAADLELDFSWDAREGREAILMTFERYTDKPQFTPLWTQLWNFVRDEGVQLVGLDTAATTFGGSENFRGQVTSFMRALVHAGVQHSCGIVLTAHPSKTGANSYSGSTAWLGSSRFAMSMQRPKDYDEETGQPSDLRVLRSLGANYTSSHHRDELIWNHGVFMLDGAAVRKAPKRIMTSQDRRDLDYKMLAYLRRLIHNGSPVPADDNSAMSLPHRAKKNALQYDAPLREFVDATTRLIDTHQVTRVDVKGRVMIRPSDMRIAGEKEWVV